MFLPDAWELVTVAYDPTIVGGTSLQRFVVIALCDVSILGSCSAASASGVETALLVLLAVVAAAEALLAGGALGYAFAHVACAIAAAVLPALSRVRRAEDARSPLHLQTHSEALPQPLEPLLTRPPSRRFAPGALPNNKGTSPGLLLLIPSALLLHSAVLRLRPACGGGAHALAWLDAGTALLLAALGCAQSTVAAKALGGISRMVSSRFMSTKPADVGPGDAATAPFLDGGDIGSGEGSADEVPVINTKSSLHDAATGFAVTIFSWLNPLFDLGELRQLDLSDLESLPSRDATRANAALFEAAIEAAAIKNPGPNRRSGALLAALLSIFGRDWAAIALLQAGCVAAALVAPLVLQQLLRYLETSNDGTGGAGSPWSGFGWAAAMVGTQVCAALVTAQFSYRVSRLQLRLRGALVPAIARRILAAPLGARHATSAGALTNYVSVDVDRLLNAVPSFHQFWSLPVQVAVVLVELHGAVSLAAGAGLAVLAVLVPVNIYIAKRIGALTGTMMTARDERLRATSELLGGLRAVRLGGFELPLLRRVAAARSAEFAALSTRKYLDALCVWCWASTPLLMALATFGTVVAMPTDPEAFSPSRVWSALALLQLLVFPLNSFPWVLSGLLESRVSLQRLESFLLSGCDSEGVPWVKSSLKCSPGSETFSDGAQVCVEGAFEFPSVRNEGNCGESSAEPDSLAISKSPFVLTLDRPGGLRILAGELVVVVGGVGSGKSALLQCMMGELCSSRKASGHTCLAPSSTLSLVPQVAWVRGVSLRENILLGEDEDAARLERVLDASGLKEEARMRGLDSVVGETTLSGGQRQRINIARALYARSSLVLMDDPTASLDAHVSFSVWESAISGAGSFLGAEGRARVVTTNDGRFVRSADRVVVLKDGLVLYCGHPSGLTHELEIAAGLRSISAVEFESAEPVARDAVADPQTHLQPSIDQPAEETRQAGVVRGAVVAAYARAVGLPLTVLTLAMLLGMQVSRNGSDFVLSLWSEAATGITGTTGPTADLAHKLISRGWGNAQFLVVYTCVVSLNFVCTAIRSWGFASAGLRAARSMHDRLLAAVVAAPQKFHDATPAGRLQNRLSGDVFAIDDSLPFSLNILLAQGT